MAVKELPTQQPTSGGVVMTLYDSGSTPSLSVGGFPNTGDQFSFQNDGKVLLEVRNGATDVDVTIETPQTVDGLAVADRVITVVANTSRAIQLNPNIYGNPTRFALDSVANVEIALIRMP